MNRHCGCHRNTHYRDWKCKSIINQSIDINTPIRIEPTVKVGRMRTRCRKPRICFHTDNGNKSACEYVIKQTIDIEIPVCYDVETDIGDSYIDCK